MRLAAIVGCAGSVLSDAEIGFIREVRPVGLILFKRNCKSPLQVRELVDSWKAAVDSEFTLVLVDQEGGRVSRLGPPKWPKIPSAASFGSLWDKNQDLGREAARINGSLIGNQLSGLGINVNCAPVLDLRVPGAHHIIGDRAFSSDPRAVIDLGVAMSKGLLSGGVLPMVKHIPGHGRAQADSHESLPVVSSTRAELEELDFTPFRALVDIAPLAMTAHVVYSELDPVNPATTSPSVVRLIREKIGFLGLLVTDDLSMKALAGPIGCSASKSRDAGCDIVLHCNGNIDEMFLIAKNTGFLDKKAKVKLETCLAKVRLRQMLDVPRALDRLRNICDQIAWA